MNHCYTVARSMPTDILRHVREALNSDLERDMSAGVVATQSHVGMIEMAQACADVICERDYCDLSILLKTDGAQPF